jgi:hypothetical protein
LAVATGIVTLSAVGAGADNEPTNGCPRGYALITTTQLGPEYHAPGIVDAAGNNDTHVCALPIQKSTPDDFQLYLFRDNTLPASSH